MIEFANFIKTNGIVGVIAVWVFFLNQDVAKLKAELSECNKEKVEIMKPFVRPKASNHTEQKMPLYAIITQLNTNTNFTFEVFLKCTNIAKDQMYIGASDAAVYVRILNSRPYLSIRAAGNEVQISGSLLISSSIIFEDGSTQTTAWVAGGTSILNQSIIIQNDPESGNFQNTGQTYVEYQASDNSPSISFTLDYQSPLTTGSEISILAVEFPDSTIQNTAFNPSAFATTGSNTFIGDQTISGSVILPTTSSGTPVYTGTQGEMIFGETGGNYEMHVWLNGGWRSTPLT
jgi:hypothetical protein